MLTQLFSLFIPLFFVLAVQADEKSERQFQNGISELNECLSGELSKNDSSFGKEKTRGNIFRLEQRSPDILSCPEPLNNAIAWSTAKDSDTSEIQFLYFDKSGKMKSVRYEVLNNQIDRRTKFELPDSEYSCASSLNSPLTKPVADMTQETSIKVQVDNWRLDKKSAMQSGSVERFSFQDVSNSKDEIAEAPEKFKKIETPAKKCDLAREIFDNLSETIENIDLFLSTMSGKDILNKVKQCRKVLDTMKPLIEYDDKPGQAAVMRLEKALDAVTVNWLSKKTDQRIEYDRNKSNSNQVDKNQSNGSVK